MKNLIPNYKYKYENKMEKEIIEKLGLKETDITSEFSFVNDLKFYKYGIYYCIAGEIDGTLNKDGLICFFNRISDKSVKVTKEFLLDCEITAIDRFLSYCLN